MSYIGKSLPGFVSNQLIQSTFSGDGSTTAFTLPESVANDASVNISIDGVRQHTSAYDVSDVSLTFTEAPPNSSEIEVVLFGVERTTISVPTSNSVGVVELDTVDGSAGQVLTTDGSGGLSFSSAGLGDLDGGDSTTVYSVADIIIDSGGAT